MRTTRDVAVAVAEMLNEQFWHIPFIAEVSHRPRHEMDQLEQLKVTVVPKRGDIVRLARDEVKTRSQIEVGVQKKLSYPEEEQDMHKLTQEIAEKLLTEELPVLGILPASVNYLTLYSPEHYDEMQVFTAVVQTEYIA